MLSVKGGRKVSTVTLINMASKCRHKVAQKRGCRKRKRASLVDGVVCDYLKTAADFEMDF